MRQPEGVAWTIVAPDAASSRGKSPVAAIFRAPTQQLPPMTSGMNSSSAAMSNTTLLSAHTRSALVAPSERRTAVSTLVSER
jgi:hypothetical protein